MMWFRKNMYYREYRCLDLTEGVPDKLVMDIALHNVNQEFPGADALVDMLRIGAKDDDLGVTPPNTARYWVVVYIQKDKMGV